MKKILVVASAFLLPSLAFAQVNTSNLETTVHNLTRVANLLVPLFLAVAVVFFIYGVITFVIAGDKEKREGARGYIVWGIVGIAAILAVWGLARLLITTFGLQPAQLQPNDIPQVPSNIAPY